VLIAALVCLSIVVAVVGSMLQGTLRARRQLHAQRDLRQTELLLQAGVDRALFRLLNNADYRGETWKLPAKAIVGSLGGQVTIEATRDSLEQPWRVRVVAEYGQGHHSSIRRSHPFLVPTNPPSDQE
jgi:hypothetical protein